MLNFKLVKLILTLYKSLVHLLLEYCVLFWSPYFRKDIVKLERIQRRVTKMIPRLCNEPYEERLAELNLFPPMKQRLIAVCKIFKGYNNVNPDSYFTVDLTNITRNNSYKITGKLFETNKAKYFFLLIALSMFGMD